MIYLKRYTSAGLVSLIFVFSLVSCSAKPGPDDPSVTNANFTQCTEPRPQICTREYLPVCATLLDASHKTYATGCTACSDPDTVGYVADPCPG
ncbi:MAG: hypothetical protein ACC641_08655 [Acidiferrobacterales bacterium]